MSYHGKYANPQQLIGQTMTPKLASNETWNEDYPDPEHARQSKAICKVLNEGSMDLTDAVAFYIVCFDLIQVTKAGLLPGEYPLLMYISQKVGEIAANALLERGPVWQRAYKDSCFGTDTWPAIRLLRDLHAGRITITDKEEVITWAIAWTSQYVSGKTLNLDLYLRRNT